MVVVHRSESGRLFDMVGASVVKTVFFPKTGNRLFKIGLKPVIVYRNHKFNNLLYIYIYIYIYIC